MFAFDNSVLKITRGDSGIVRLNLKTADGTEVSDYTAVLTLKKNIHETENALQIACDSGKFQFDHSSTENLTPGNYVYDVQIIRDGAYTTIGPYQAIVIPDVTRGD